MVLEIGVRPVRAPKHPIRELLDQAAREGNDVAIGILFAVQRRRPRDRQPLRAGDLAPNVPVVAHELEEQRELGPIDGLCNIRPAHVVDDYGGRQSGEEIQEFGQVHRLEIDHDVPAEGGDPPRDLHQFVLRREVDEPFDEIEAHAAHARLVEPLELIVARVALYGRDAARFACAREAGVDHRAVVGAVARRLHHDIASEPQMIAQGEELGLACVAGRIFALGRVWERGPGPEHVAVRIDAARRQAKARLARAVIPVEPHLSFFERPGDGLCARGHDRSAQSTYFNPAFSNGSRILYMSRPRTPAASFARLSPSLASRTAASAAVFAARSAGTTTTPSSSATMASPGVTSAPAQTIGMLTEPNVAFTVPLALMHLLQTGKAISVSVFTSRTPASMIRARAPRALKLVARRSPKKPSVLSAVMAATTMSPGWICSAAT